MPYMSDVGGLCLKGFSEPSLKFIRSTLHLPKAPLIMTASWLGETYPMSSDLELGTFVAILQLARMRDLEAANYIIKVDVKAKSRE